MNRRIFFNRIFKFSRKLHLSYSLLLFTQLLVIPVFAQTGNPIPSSPNMASIEKYGNYPISYNTGTVGISASLYQFTLTEGLNLDIRLDYHSSGIKVEDRSGSVGTGWTLFAGGGISRVIRGLRDESSGNGFYHFIQKHKGYKFPQELLAAQVTIDSIADERLDSSPDIFHLNLQGKSYKFFLNNDGEFYTIPYSNLKFNMHPLSYEKTAGWEITDESGIRYIFKQREMVDDSQWYDSYVSAWWLTCIESAEGNILASFEYVAGLPNNVSEVTQTTQHFKIWSDVHFPIGLEEEHLKKQKIKPVINSDAVHLSKINIPGKGHITFYRPVVPVEFKRHELISEIRLYDTNEKMINKYSLDYTYDSRPYLSEIVKTSVDKDSIKYRRFNYYPGLPSEHSMAQDIWGYYNGVTGNKSLYPYDATIKGFYTIADRSSAIEAMAGTIKEIIYPSGGKTLFEFENNIAYHLHTIYTMKKKSMSHHHYEYGKSTSSSFTISSRKLNDLYIDMPIHPAGVYRVKIALVNVDTKESVLSYTNGSVPGNGFVHIGPDSNGMILFRKESKDANIPAGTYRWETEIETDNTENKPSPIKILIHYSEKVASDINEEIEGGLRIAQISNFDTDEKLTGKIRYSYLNGKGQSSGIAAPKPRFTREHTIVECILLGTMGALIDTRLRVRSIGGFNLDPYLGSPVQYTHVTEEKIGESQFLKTEYSYNTRVFTNKPSVSMHGTDNNYTPYSLNEYEEGLLTSKIDYEYKNDSYTPIRKEYNTYNIKNYGADIPMFKAVHLTRNYSQKCGSEIQPMKDKYEMGTYDFIAAKVYLSSKKIEEITSQGTITNLEEYFYDNPKYQQLTRVKQKISNRVNEISYKYCYDESTTVSKLMKDKNILSPLWSTIKKVDGKQIKLSNITYGSFSNNVLKPKSIKEQIAAETPYSETTIHDYDKFGNPLYISQNGTNQVVYLWSYSGQYPIAEIRNTTLTEVNSVMKSIFGVLNVKELSSKSFSSLEGKLLDGSLQKSLPNALVTTYTYDPLKGMLTTTNPSGITTYYEYDSFGRLKETYFVENNIKKNIQSYDYNFGDK